MTLFQEYYYKFATVKDWDSFVLFFNNEPLPMQIVVGATIFGCSYLVYLFFAGILSDKHN